MKFLLLLALVLIVAWLWRSSRRKATSARDEEAPPQTGQQEMVRCAHCGVHLPHGEALVGRIGRYCSAEHRQAAEP